MSMSVRIKGHGTYEDHPLPERKKNMISIFSHFFIYSTIRVHVAINQTNVDNPTE